MPYTLSHAIVALPITKISRGKIPLAAIAIGAVSPDFPYLLAMSPTYAPGHSLVGVIVYCLIPSLIITLIWFHWIEKPTLEFWKLPVRKYQEHALLVLVVGILLGAYSHVLWDATSHSYAVIVDRSEFLQREILNRPIYKWNQYLSGLLGLAAVMLWYIAALVKNNEASYKGNVRVGVPIYILSIAFFTIFGIHLRQPDSLVNVVVTLSITTVNGFLLGVCIYAVWTKVTMR